jgi:hypothetical protein
MQATLIRPAGGLAVGQRQPRPHRRRGVEQADHGVAQLGPLGLADRRQGTGLVALACRI